jgi:hypothetical protein
MLEEAKIIEGQVVDGIKRIRQRQSLTEFKQFVAHLAIQQALSVCVQSVCHSDIFSARGTCNRLYQLLVKGKAPYSKMLEYVAVLGNASNRNDLVLEKQCCALVDKANDFDCAIDVTEQYFFPCRNEECDPICSEAS